MKAIPHVSTAPHVVLRNGEQLPPRETLIWRDAWADAQIDVMRRFWKRNNQPLTSEDESRLRRRILDGVKH